MTTRVLMSLAAALALAPAAFAQTPTPLPRHTIPNAHPSASVNPPTTAGLRPGMAVKDRSGAIIGTISQVGLTSDGRPMAQVLVDGRQVLTPAANLSTAQNGAFAATPLSKAQLLATAVR